MLYQVIWSIITVRDITHNANLTIWGPRTGAAAQAEKSHDLMKTLDLPESTINKIMNGNPTPNHQRTLSIAVAYAFIVSYLHSELPQRGIRTHLLSVSSVNSTSVSDVNSSACPISGIRACHMAKGGTLALEGTICKMLRQDVTLEGKAVL